MGRGKRGGGCGNGSEGVGGGGGEVLWFGFEGFRFT